MRWFVIQKSLRPTRLMMGLIVVCAAAQLALLVCVALWRADTARGRLYAERSGLPVTELRDDLRPALAADTVMVRATSVLPSASGPVTWTQVGIVRPGQLPPHLPSVEGTFVSPRLAEMLTTAPPVAEVLPPASGVLEGADVAGPDELVVVTVLPEEAWRALPRYELVGPKSGSDALGVTVGNTRVATTAFGTALVLVTASLARLFALARATDLAVLRLIGWTTGTLRVAVAAQIGLAWAMAGGLTMAASALRLGSGSISLFGVAYARPELDLPLAVRVLSLIGAGIVVMPIVMWALRRMTLDPLAVHLRRRAYRADTRRPVRWLWGGSASLGLVLVGARLLAVPDAVILAAQVASLLALIRGLLGIAPSVIRSLADLVKAPLPLFVVARQTAADPRSALATATAVAVASLTLGVVTALGPASDDGHATTRPFGDAVVLASPDGDVAPVVRDLAVRLPQQEIGLFDSGALTLYGSDADTEAVVGTCGDLVAAGVRLVAGRCVPGSLIHVNGAEHAIADRILATQWDGTATTQLDTTVTGLGVTAGGGPFFALPRQERPAQADQAVMDVDASAYGPILAAAQEAPAHVETRIPALDDEAFRVSRIERQGEAASLVAVLVALAALAATASGAGVLWDRRGSWVVLRLTGLTLARVRTVAAMALAVPFALATVLSGASGYVIGAAAGYLIDGRTAPTPGPLAMSLALITGLIGVLAGLISVAGVPSAAHLRRDG